MRRPPPQQIALGHRLRELREARELTQEQLADRVGYNGKYISEVERGTRDVPLSTLARIATGLDLLPGDLLPRSKEEMVDRVGQRQERARLDSIERLESILASLPREERKRALVLVRSLVSFLEL